MTRKVGYLYSRKFLEHKPSSFHPESPNRLLAIQDNLIKTGLLKELVVLRPKKLKSKYLETVHDRRYVEIVKSAAQNSNNGNFYLDSDTYVSKASYEVALLAAGGTCVAIDALFDNVISAAFCAIRPPGHHAEVDRALGFCLFNNAAIAAKYAQKKYKVKRILILDWDVHHGNGTQSIFYADPSVFYVSIHQYPFYPGTGSAKELGSGEGKGYTRNFPVEKDAGDDEYRTLFRGPIKQIFASYKPQLVVVSAGFDAHQLDPLGELSLSTEMFGEMTRYVKEYGDNAPILSVLEGGYDLKALAESVEAHIRELLR